MFPRSSMGIRRLISQRKDRDQEDEESHPPLPPTSFFEHDDTPDTSQFKAAISKQLKSRSWISPKQPKQPKQTKKAPKPIVIIRRSEDIERVKQGLAPLCDTPRSSNSSLCSCDFNEFDLTRPRPSPRRPGGRSPSGSPYLCPPTPPLVTKNLGMQKHKSHSGLAQGHHRSRSSPQSMQYVQKVQMITPPNSAKSSLDFQKPVLQAEQGSTAWNEPLPTPPHTAQGGFASEVYPGSADQPREVRDSLEAEKPAVEAPAAILASQDPSAGILPTSAVPRSPRKQRPPPLSRSASRRGSVAPGKSVPKSPRTPTRTPSRSSSISKARVKGRKPVRRPRGILHKANTSRWTLSENARDLFIVRIFHRIEADEMLPESKLEEIRGNTKSRKSMARSRSSQETLSAAETETPCDTPLEPFHLEGLPSRIGAAGVNMSMPSPIAEVPTPGSAEINATTGTEPMHDGASSAAAAEPQDEYAVQTGHREIIPLEEGGSMTYRIVSFPAPPAKNPARYAQRKGLAPDSRQLPPLPTIPEVTVTSPEKATASLASQPADTSSDDFIYLPGTSYTMICPTHKQGPIRLCKEELSIAPFLAAIDDTLDWTAFQMAISGGAGDFFSESTDYSRLSDEELDEREDLADWFDSLGFDSPGNLIEHESAPDGSAGTAMSTPSSMPSPGSARSQHSASPSNSSPRTVSSGRSPHLQQEPQSTGNEIGLAISNLPIPVECEHPSGFWNSAVPSTHREHFYARQSTGIKRWGAEGHPRRPAYSTNGTLLSIDSAKSNKLSMSQYRRVANRDLRRPSVDSVHSLPQSPMLELVVNKDVDGNEYVVPMGFNLGHDLGDYLQWEAEYVFGGGYTTEN